MPRTIREARFAMAPQANIQRSTFNRGHLYKTTFNAGYLIPFYVDEALPGDTFTLRASLFARLATPIVPIMDNLYIETFFFAIPNRLLWSNWQAFNGEQKDPGDSTDFIVPQLPVVNPGFVYGSLGDYFGLPTSVYPLSISALPFRAYNLVWNEWFRDENLQSSIQVNTADGPDDMSMYNLMRRGKRHDYFTSALPWPQKGPGVELPIGSTANINFVGGLGNVTLPVVSTGAPTFNVSQAGGPGPQTLSVASNLSGTDNQGVVIPTGGYPPTTPATVLNWSNPNLQASGALTIPPGSLVADLSTAQAATINSFRQAMQLQKLLERDARGGTRYTEILRAHFGVISPDARLQRPEYLGGSSQRVTVMPVQQTSATDSTSPQGNLAAFGYVADNIHGFTKSFVEHCVILGLVNIRADLTYQQGINRAWSRKTRYDFYWPVFAHLGEQSVLNKEIYAQGTSVIDGATNEVVDEQVFGYQERWAEYRYFPSKITGKFRSNDPQTLDIWHLSQSFASLPTLSDSFIQDNPPIGRIIAVPSEPHFLFDSEIQLRCARPMPIYSIPGWVDHF